MSVIGLLVALVIVSLLYWGVTRILAAFGVGDPIATLVKVVLVIVIVLWALSALGLVGNFGTLRLR